MNVFVLDKDPYTAAQYHTDKHVIKMVLESAQILSTACYLNNIIDCNLYKPTHIKHPCVVEAAISKENYFWVLSLFSRLCDEYLYRFSKIHKSSSLLPYLTNHVEKFPSSGSLCFAQAMPDEYKNEFYYVDAYRSYYQACKMKDKNGKSMAFWTKRQKPWWLTLDKQEDSSKIYETDRSLFY